MKKVYVSYGRTVSANYQSKKYEFGFFVDNCTAVDVSQAYTLCEAVVNKKLGQKAGLTRRKLDSLAGAFFDTDFDTLIGRQDEEV